MTALWTNSAEEQPFLLCFLMAVFGLKTPFVSLDWNRGAGKLLCAGMNGVLLALSPCGPASADGGPVSFRFLPFNSSSRVIVWSQLPKHLRSGFVSSKHVYPPTLEPY